MRRFMVIVLLCGVFAQTPPPTEAEPPEDTPQTVVSYQVQGPDSEVLAEALDEALAQWISLDDTLAAELRPDGLHIFRFGDTDRFPPGTHSLTVQRQQPSGRTVESLLRQGGERLEQALLHEVGIMFGLPVAEAGIMNPRFNEETPPLLGETERETLETLEQFEREDINRDGVVDFYDLVQLARAFGRQGVNLPEDLNQDGVVDERDLELLRQRYTFTPPAASPPGSDVLEDDPELPTFDDAPTDAPIDDPFFEDPTEESPPFFPDEPTEDEEFP
jgi:hypothetical protein